MSDVIGENRQQERRRRQTPENLLGQNNTRPRIFVRSLVFHFGEYSAYFAAFFARVVGGLVGFTRCGRSLFYPPPVRSRFRASLEVYIMIVRLSRLFFNVVLLHPYNITYGGGPKNQLVDVSCPGSPEYHRRANVGNCVTRKSPLLFSRPLLRF